MSPLPFVEAGVGPPVVLLHGWTMDGTAFAGQVRRLSDRFRVIAPDLPGHGRALGLETGIEPSAERLLALLDALDLRGVTLVGWSMGASVAWRALASGAGRVARMMSVDMGPKVVNEDGWTLGMAGQDAASCAALGPAFRASPAALAPAVAAGMFAPGGGPAEGAVSDYAAKVAAADPDAMAACWASLIAEDARPAVRACPVPLLAAHGAASRVYPAATAEWIAARAPDGATLRFPASGHSPHLEEPDRFAAALAAFAAGAPVA